jgi:hypothetical protein
MQPGQSKVEQNSQIMVEINSRAHPAKPVVVEIDVTTPNCFVGFWGPECPHCTNDLCPALVETRLRVR